MLSENLKKIREAKGYSKTKLAKKTGLSARCLEFLEHGKITNPTINTIKKIAKALDVSINDLIT